MIHNHAAVAVALAAAVLLLLACRRNREPGPVYVTRNSPVAGLGVLLAGLGVFIYARRHPAPAPASTPAPRPSAVTHTITQQVTRYVPVHNWPVSGLELTLLGLGVLAAAVLIVRLAGRYFGR
jgi:hypothetical protein